MVLLSVSGLIASRIDVEAAGRAALVRAATIFPMSARVTPATPTSALQETRTAPFHHPMPAATPEAERSTVTPTPLLAGQVPAVASGLRAASLLAPMPIPPTNAPDVVGAFRFLCGAGQVLSDDPIVYLGQPGRAHLHQFFGNLDADAHSTYASLRAHGDSTCMNALNRSAYWMPAMLDGRGHVVRPRLVSIYYKRRPASDPFCQTGGKGCVDLPRGLRFITGWDQFRPNEKQRDNVDMFNWKCIKNNDAINGVHPNMVEPAKVCKPGSQLMGVIHTQTCWDGVNLDSSDHRSHLAIPSYGSWGYEKCPRRHPYILPQFTMGVIWDIESGDEPTKWTLSSDMMKPGGVPGATFHTDWYGAWEDDVMNTWISNCIDKLLNCSDGDLGNGKIMARGKHYPSGAPVPRLVPIPPLAH